MCLQETSILGADIHTPLPEVGPHDGIGGDGVLLETVLTRGWSLGTPLGRHGLGLCRTPRKRGGTDVRAHNTVHPPDQPSQHFGYVPGDVESMGKRCDVEDLKPESAGRVGSGSGVGNGIEAVVQKHYQQVVSG